MDRITQWFNSGTEYHEGVAIYAALPDKSIRILKQLNRGKNNQNMATLVSLLRKHKNAPVKEEPKKPVLPTPAPKAPTQEVINVEQERSQLAKESTTREFSTIRLGDLPAELRPRFLRARQVFYDMIELKFALNDLPPDADKSALSIQLQILDLDEERDLIWKELHHWHNHRSILKVPTDDFAGLTNPQLYQKKRNLTSSVSKIEKRLEEKYALLDKETNKHQQLLIENQIKRSEQTLHTHQLNIKKIDELL